MQYYIVQILMVDSNSIVEAQINTESKVQIPLWSIVTMLIVSHSRLNLFKFLYGR